MKLIFHGTLSSIAQRNARHARQSQLEVAFGGRSLLIDCGSDWLGRLPAHAPAALLLTHAHPDHIGGLVDGAACPVYADAVTWEKIETFPLLRRRLITPGQPFYVAGIRCEGFALQHSPRAPAVGYLIQAGRSTIFYCPDVAAIVEQHRALRGVQMYIGDGASYRQSLLRWEDDMLYGHAPLRDQLRWCAEEKVPRMVISHCGEEIIDDENRVVQQLQSNARKLGIKASIAHDGMILQLP
jgi:phosphoribosyl 1,2-cyclic phosphodiesterase